MDTGTWAWALLALIPVVGTVGAALLLLRWQRGPAKRGQRRAPESTPSYPSWSEERDGDDPPMPAPTVEAAADPQDLSFVPSHPSSISGGAFGPQSPADYNSPRSRRRR